MAPLAPVILLIVIIVMALRMALRESRTVERALELRESGHTDQALEMLGALARARSRTRERERALFELARTHEVMGQDATARGQYRRYFQDYVVNREAPGATPERAATVRARLTALGEPGVEMPLPGESKTSYWARYKNELESRIGVKVAPHHDPAVHVKPHEGPHPLEVKILSEIPHARPVEPPPLPTFDPARLARDEKQLAVGQRVGGYVLAEKLGEGGFGEVFRALRPVAIKLARDPSVVEHLRKFGTIQGAIKSDRVVKPLEINLEADPPYVVMELVDGCTLRDVLATKRLSVAEALVVLREVGLGLRDCHEQGVLHLDLKPENVLVDESGKVKLTDFDLGRMTTPEAAQFRLSRSMGSVESDGKVAGTIAYMSPEQRDGKVPDARSDIYTFGVLLFEALTGELPQPGDKPSELRKDGRVPPEVDRIFERCFTRTERRYHTIREAVLDLEYVIAQENVSVDLANLLRDAPGAVARVAQRAAASPPRLQAKPVEAKPVEAKPVEAKPVEAKPVEAKPVEAKPVEAKPVEAKPVEAKPVAVAPVLPVVEPPARPALVVEEGSAPTAIRPPLEVSPAPVAEESKRPQEKQLELG